MKKVKIILTAFIVTAVVGGTLAFKAAKFNNPYCIVTSVTNVDSNTPNQACEQAVNTRADNNGQFYLATPKPAGTTDCTTLTCSPRKLAIIEGL